MKRKKLIIVLLLFFALLLAAVEKPLLKTGINIFSNPGFEKTAKEMEPLKYEVYSRNTAISEALSMTGKRSLRFSLNDKEKSGKCYTQLGIVDGEIPKVPVKYNGYVYVNSLNGAGELRIFIASTNQDAKVRVVAECKIDLASLPLKKWIPIEASGFVAGGALLDFRMIARTNVSADLYLDDINVRLGNDAEEGKPSLKLAMLPQWVYRNTASENTLYIASGYPGFIHIIPNGTPGKMNSISLTVDVPDGMDFKVFGYQRRGQPENEQSSKSETTEKGKRYKLKLSPLILSSHNSGYYLFFDPAETQDLNGKKINWELEVNGKISDAGSLKIRMLELPETKLPENFKLYAYYATILDFDATTGLQKRNFDLLERLGIKGIVSPRWSNRPTVVQKWKTAYERNWWLGAYANVWLTFVPRTEDNLTRRADGSAVKFNESIGLVEICPQYLIENLKNYHGKISVPNYPTPRTGVYLDHEPYCAGAVTTFCFCPRCVRTFAAEYRLGDELTPAKIQQKYIVQWRKFREEQQAKLIGEYFKLYTFMKPDIETIFCSLYERPDDNFAAIRNQLYEKFTDYFMPMIYEKGIRLFDHVRYNCRSTSKPMVPFIYSMAEGFFEDWNSPEEFELALLTIAACGGRGAALYAQTDFDGKYAYHTLQVMKRVKNAEEFYYKGKSDDTVLKIPESVKLFPDSFIF